MNKFISKIRSNLVKFILWNYRILYIPLRVYIIRRKSVIKVAFIIHSLGAWKSELLYKEMLSHPRFDPELLILAVYEEDDRENIKRYLKDKEYRFIDITNNNNIKETGKYDLIFYQKPYHFSIPDRYNFKKNPHSLFCYVNYGFHGVDDIWSRDTLLLNNCWQIYYENIAAWRGSRNVMRNRCRNGVVTGLPIMDELLISKEKLSDPWDPQTKRKKRIIWAPHHSISDKEYVDYSTFLEYCDFMVRIAYKYREEVQWAFKPHPILRNKLESVWGKEKTDLYWKKWEEMDNTQVETGKYLELFKYSDAMIHDCGSFTIEYLYTGNPVMYVIKNENITNNFNEFQQSAFDLHIKGANSQDIENFVRSIIYGEDLNKHKRQEFFNINLIPPNGRTASENIITAILGDHL